MKALLNTPVPFFARRSMAAATLNGKLYMFGGVGANTGTESILDVSNDLWIFDPEKLEWTRSLANIPLPSPRRCVGWLGFNDRVLLWGGSGITEMADGKVRYTFINDLWEYIPSTDKWNCLRNSDDHLNSPLEGVLYPPPRYTPVFQKWEKDSLFLFGGYSEDRLGKRKMNDLWLCRKGQWSHVSNTAAEGYRHGASWPGLRYGCMSASDDCGIYIYGGFADDGDHNDLWRFNTSSLNWELLFPEDESSVSPHPRYCAAFALYGKKLFLFGGRSRIKPKLNFNDLWVFDLERSEWTMIADNDGIHIYDGTVSRPGYHAKTGNAVIGKYWYIWGGEGRNGHVSDFWRLDMENIKWELIQAARSDDPSFW